MRRVRWLDERQSQTGCRRGPESNERPDDLTQRIQVVSRDVLTVNAGSLYPALYRLEQRGLVRAAWQETDKGRRARVYSTTAAGRKELAAQRLEWQRFSGALAAILRVG